jgi:hypothetical protein
MDMKTKSKLFFSRRNTNVTNRYELDQRRGSRRNSKFERKNKLPKVILKTEQVLQEAAPQRGNSNRDYTANRTSFKEQLTKRKL